jgi:casein kinase 1
VDQKYIKALLWFGTGFQFDYVFDWTILKYQQSQSTGGPQRVSVGLL